MTQQQTSASKTQMSPTDLLLAQYETLSAMYADQAEHNRRMVAALESMDDILSNHLTPVKVEDVDMPFTAMVGFMLKVAVASIPATIIFILLFACAWMFLIAGGWHIWVRSWRINP